MAENIAFSDWSEKLDTAGTNHWLPAYGLQQPSVAVVGNNHQQNDPTFDSSTHDTDYFDDNNGNYNALLLYTFYVININMYIHYTFIFYTHMHMYIDNILYRYTHTYMAILL